MRRARPAGEPALSGPRTQRPAPSAYPGTDDARLARRVVRVLVGSQVLGGVGVASGLAVGGLLAEDVSGSAALSGLAQTATVLGAAVAALPLARLMAARGRRPGLVAAYVTGAVGAAVVVAGGAVRAFPLVLVGATLFGAATAANLQARYAATDLVEPVHRARALSTVVWATTVGAVLGPNLTGPGGELAGRLGLPALTGPYVLSVAGFLLAAAVVASRLRPDPLLVLRARGSGGGDFSAESRRGSLRLAWRAVAASRRATLGLVAVALAHTVMVAVMVMTPVHMRDGGAELPVIGLVISVHIAGMYAFAPVMGWLADRAGRLPVIVGAQCVLLAAVLVAGTSGPGHSGTLGVGLFLLGLGWSGALVAGSTLLTDAVPAHVRPAVQGGADFVMGMCAAAGGALAGVVLAWLGYGALNALAGGLTTPVLLLALACRRRSNTRSG